MKNLLPIFFALTAIPVFAQEQVFSYNSIDQRAASLNANRLDSLAIKLTSIYSSDLEKTRSIFSWITQHIAYNTGIFHSKTTSRIKFIPEAPDTMVVWKTGIEMTAEKVLRRRFALCDGYAKLFQCLCDYAGLHAVIISGYAKCRRERGEPFRTNHSWNAVMIDGSWHLLDLTWASGYINEDNEFVPRTDESYFLTPPKQFILDHCPEDIRWTLLEKMPVLKEFGYSPFVYKSFVKYGIDSFKPSRGIIEATIGDTIHIEVNVKDAKINKKISPDPFFDSTVLTLSPASLFLQPTSSHNRSLYTYIVKDRSADWLNILYNDDIVLRYKLVVKKGRPLPTPEPLFFR